MAEGVSTEAGDAAAETDIATTSGHMIS